MITDVYNFKYFAMQFLAYNLLSTEAHTAHTVVLVELRRHLLNGSTVLVEDLDRLTKEDRASIGSTILVSEVFAFSDLPGD